MILKTDEFQLRWWRLNLDGIRYPRNDAPSDLTALTIIGTTDLENRAITKWCEDNSVFRKTKRRFFGDCYYSTVSKDLFEFDYLENEQTVMADSATMARLEEWLETIPRRDRIIALSGFSTAQLRRICRGHDARILQDQYDPENHLISLADGPLVTELVLRMS